jgi:hypothetical protein
MVEPPEMMNRPENLYPFLLIFLSSLNPEGPGRGRDNEEGEKDISPVSFRHRSASHQPNSSGGSRCGCRCK